MSEFQIGGAQAAGTWRRGPCRRCGGDVTVLYRPDQTCRGALAHRSPAECLPQLVEGGTEVTYDARLAPPGAVRVGDAPAPRRRRGYATAARIPWWGWPLLAPVGAAALALLVLSVSAVIG